MEQKKIMGRPPKYTKEEAIRAKAKRNNEWVSKAYERTTVCLPAGFKEKINQAAKKNNTSKRQIIISALEQYLKQY